MRFLIVFLLVLFVFPVAVANAQNVAGIEITPGIIEEGADPGEVFTTEVSVTNVSDTTETYYLIKRDISGVRQGNVPVFAEEGQEVTGFELSEWVSLPDGPIDLDPGQQIRVPITITVPDDATPGSHFGGIFVSREPPRLRQIGAGVGYDVGSIISIRISGDVVESARIRAFSTDRLIYSTPNVTFETRVENPGNVLIRPRGPLEVKNMFGDQVGLLIVNDDGGGVFPGTTRSFDVVWEDDGIGFGRYQAIVALGYGQGGGQATVDATVSFWILPLNIILPVLGAIAFLVLAIYIAVKIHINRAVRELSTGRGRRVVARRRKDSGMSSLVLVAVALLVATSIFLIGLLVLFA